jgi:ABC transporter substrate binding protein/Enoyl-(Acyl carrier protein) reductase
MKRREFIAALASVIVGTSTGPRAASAQPAQKARRIGVLMGLSESNPAFPRLVDAFVQELARLGWVDGHNARIEQRWTNADAAELVASQFDVIVCSTTPAAAALHRERSTVPIIFTVVSDPVGAGFVAGLPRPGGNMTGFINTEAGVAGKWLSLLKEIAPGIKRAGIMFNPDTGARRRKILPGFVRGRRPKSRGRASRYARSQRCRDRDGNRRAWVRRGPRPHGRLLHGRSLPNDHFLGGSKNGQTIEQAAVAWVKANRPSSIIQRAATTEEVAKMVVYAVSPQASATTGAALRVDGGVVDTIT